MSSTSAINCDDEEEANPKCFTFTTSLSQNSEQQAKDKDVRQVVASLVEKTTSILATLSSSSSLILAIPPPTSRNEDMMSVEGVEVSAASGTIIIAEESHSQGNDSPSDGGSTMSGSGSSRSNSPIPANDLKPTAISQTDQESNNSVGKKKTVSASTSTSSGSSSDKRNRKKRVQPQTSKSKIKKQHDYKYVCSAKEDHGQPIFGCQFRPQRNEADPLILATVGSNRISIYECLSDGKLKMLQVFADPDSAEIFYCCAWTESDTGKALLAAAGARGIIRILSTYHAACVKHYLGHGHSINDLTFHPKDPNLLLSASKDHSLRMYNIKTDYLVATFGGVDGHRDEVLAADIDITGSRIISCGMDHSLKVWKLNKPEVQKAIAASYTHNPKNSNPFPTAKQNFPDFSTRDIHRNYVDCTKWFGDFILSKSCENSIICWKAGSLSGNWDDVRISTTETTFIHRLDIKDCDIWFIRFSMDYWKKILALGNQNGKTYIYDLRQTPPTSKASTILSHPKCTSAIRQTALSRDGRVLVCVCDDASIWRWDLSQESADDGADESDKDGT